MLQHLRVVGYECARVNDEMFRSVRFEFGLRGISAPKEFVGRGDGNPSRRREGSHAHSNDKRHRHYEADYDQSGTQQNS